MPLNPEDVEPIGQTLDGRVLSFFKRNRGLAFEVEEIFFELSKAGVVTTRESVEAVLFGPRCPRKARDGRARWNGILPIRQLARIPATEVMACHSAALNSHSPSMRKLFEM